MATIGSRVKALRRKLHLTQVEFAQKIRVKGGVVSAWENGSAPVPYGRVKIICDAYHVNEDWLVNGKGEMSAQAVAVPSRDAALQYLYQILLKMPFSVRDETLGVMRDLITRFDCNLDETPEDPSEYIEESEAYEFASADDDFDEVDEDDEEDYDFDFDEDDD